MRCSPPKPDIHVARDGIGAEVFLIHGGASPEATWAGLESLRQRWTVAVVYRRGFPPSPAPPDARQDFEVDAADLISVLDGPRHVVGHSYGGTAALVAAGQRPDLFRSLVLLEPAHSLAAEDPDVARLNKLGETVLAHGLETQPELLREFLRISGVAVGDGPLPDEVINGIRRAHNSRSPYEARPAFSAIRNAGLPRLVVSGDHNAAIEKVCDALTHELAADRAVFPGGGHFIPRAPGFLGYLERYLSRSESDADQPPAG
jgi:pimeloyl-ACP methyl ester carboxylesterase